MRKLEAYWRPYLRAIPPLLAYQLLSKVILAAGSFALTRLTNALIYNTGRASITSGDFVFLLGTWQGWLILLLGFLLLAFYVLVDLNATILCCNSILQGKRVSVWTILKEGLKTFPRFWSKDGILYILFLAFATPIVGIGLTVPLTKNLKIPNFVTSVIFSDPLYTMAYLAGIAALASVIYTRLFALHFIVLDGETPQQAGKSSVAMMKDRRLHFRREYAAFFLGMLLLVLLLTVVFLMLPMTLVAALPMTETARRFWTLFVSLNGIMVVTIAGLLFPPLQVLELTRIFRSYTTGNGRMPVGKGCSWRWLWRRLIVIPLAALGLALLLNAGFDNVFMQDIPVQVIAHRAGGVMAGENTLGGLEAAIEAGAHGAEIDVQRTADGAYILNHDSTFGRLTGVARAPKDMTLEEIKTLRIPSRDGEEEVAALNEILDAAKDRIHLYIELKGDTADPQMADDVVAMLKERGMLDQATILSLDYHLIDYVESTYPEVETGYLCYFTVGGDATGLNCDILVLEEQPATAATILKAHLKGKKVIVWTVNTPSSLDHFLLSAADAIITDQVPMAEEKIAELNARNEFDRIIDWLFSQ